MFFNDHGFGSYDKPTPKVQAAWDKAKIFCADCPVVKECARDSLGELDGVWGGLDPAQRKDLRTKHGHSVRSLTGDLKVEYATLAYQLTQQLGWPEAGRVIGLHQGDLRYLVTWYVTMIKKRLESESADKAAAKKAAVIKLPRAKFPGKPPKEGDGWVRLGGSVVRGHYLGETEDGSHFLMRVALSKEHSNAWYKAEDVKILKPITRQVRPLVGGASRNYGKANSSGNREPARAG